MNGYHHIARILEGMARKEFFFDDDNNNNKHLIMRQYWRIINVNKERKGDK